MFMLGSILNYELNNILKNWIKEPRPNNPLPYIDDHLIKGAQIYGMPSGHAQIISFTIVFMILTKRPVYLILFSSFIGMLTLIQRWKYRRHTIEQLIGGTIVGSFFAYFIFWITEFYLQRT
jgi:membrane-associated phospholipid phosphatase